MWNDRSDKTGYITKLDKIKKNDIGGASGTQLARSLIFFST